MKLFQINKRLKIFIFVAFVIIAGTLVLYVQKRINLPSIATYGTVAEKDIYVRFVMEGYEKIKENYWKKVDDAVLSQHFQLSLQKASNLSTLPELKTKDRDGTASMIFSEMILATSTELKRNLARNTLMVATFNLYPIGRNSVLSEAQEKNLRNLVANIDPNKDLYKDLGLESGANTDAIKTAYDKKSAELKSQNLPGAEAEQKKITYAKEVLTNIDSKNLYDQKKIEPTSSNKIIDKTLYTKMDKISPTTLLEFVRTVTEASSTPYLNSMIIDLRGNLGGSLDFTTNFLGLFLGLNQYTFDLFHQDDYNVQRTVQSRFPLLQRFEEIAILTDKMTQSSAEVIASAFKRFKLGVIVGSKTRGWGTIENTFPLLTEIDPNEKYSLFLVHSLTIRDDGEPIESNGVLPNVDVSTPNWGRELEKHIRSSEFASTIKKVINGK